MQGGTGAEFTKTIHLFKQARGQYNSGSLGHSEDATNRPHCASILVGDTTENKHANRQDTRLSIMEKKKAGTGGRGHRGRERGTSFTEAGQGTPVCPGDT